MSVSVTVAALYSVVLSAERLVVIIFTTVVASSVIPQWSIVSVTPWSLGRGWAGLLARW